MIHQDPLCRRHANGWPADRCESCRALRTARLQGPIHPGPHHAPLCWCNRCLEASNAIHGVTE